jgi:hypothetical protein
LFSNTRATGRFCAQPVPRQEILLGVCCSAMGVSPVRANTFPSLLPRTACAAAWALDGERGAQRRGTLPLHAPPLPVAALSAVPRCYYAMLDRATGVWFCFLRPVRIPAAQRILLAGLRLLHAYRAFSDTVGLVAD